MQVCSLGGCEEGRVPGLNLTRDMGERRGCASDRDENES